MAVVLFLASGFFGSLFIRSFAHYAGDVSKNWFETPSFRYQMNRFITEMYFSSQFSGVSTVEDFEKTTEGKRINRIYDEKILAVTQAYNILENSGIEVHRDAQNRYRYFLNYNNVGYYFSYNGDIISEEDFNSLEYVEFEESRITSVTQGTVSFTRVEINVYDPYESGSVPQYVNDISQSLRILGEVDDYTCFGEVGKDDIIAVIEAERRVELESSCYSRNTRNSLIDSVKNVNYAIIYNSGVAVTNCGITATDTEAQILEKLGSERFAEGYSNGKYKLYKGNAPKTSNSVFGLLREWMFSDYYTKSQLETQTFVSGYNEDVVAAYVAVPENDAIDGFSISEKAYSDFVGNRINSPAILLTITVITFLLACAACIYLIAVAGKTADGVKINFTDKVPAEINWVLGLAAMFLLAVAAFFLVVGEFDPSGMAHDYYYEGVKFVNAWMNSLAQLTSELIAVCFAGFFMIWTALNMSLARNIRNKTFIKHTLCYLILSLAFKLLKFILKPVRKLFWHLWKKSKRITDKVQYIFTCDYSKGQGTKFKIIAFVSAILFVVITPIYYVLAFDTWYNGNGLFGFMLIVFGILGDLAILGFILLIIVSADRIFEAVNDVKNGNLNRTIDTKYMPPFMKRFAEDILSMQDGLQNAVESAVRDQRMKAELITNVSHDLKTPLTSIVTYVDLLKKCDIEGEDANRYVGILDEKAQKMKKLIEDLVEASKASSGAMEIHPVKINLCEFAAQAVGEHEDELKKKNIEILLRMPEYPVMAMADSQKTSRVVENLFSNIRKYAMEGTRAYVEVAESERECSIVFKNISAEPLDVSADELTQRFVRGDASRSSEGNGLGLSIAKNLCELQKGRLELSIDGDLFKATVILPKA